MKKNFVKPSCKVILIENNIIRTSGCNCVTAGVDFGSDECSNVNLPECTCKTNVDDWALGNCV